MTYLFTYCWSGRENGLVKSGNGSMDIRMTNSDKITVDAIYGKGGAKEMATKALEDSGMTEIELCPMGFFKFDEEGDADGKSSES